MKLKIHFTGVDQFMQPFKDVLTIEGFNDDRRIVLFEYGKEMAYELFNQYLQSNQIQVVYIEP